MVSTKKVHELGKGVKLVKKSFLKLKGLIEMQTLKIEEVYIGAEKLKRNMKGENNV